MDEVTLEHFLCLASLIFTIGFSGMLLNRHNLIAILMSLELMLLSININLVAIDRFINQMDGQVLVFFILAIAACEAAIGLAIFVLLYRSYRIVDTEQFNNLRG